jgi:hypothetical protein
VEPPIPDAPVTVWLREQHNTTTVEKNCTISTNAKNEIMKT